MHLERWRRRARGRLTIAVAGLALAGCGAGLHPGGRASARGRALEATTAPARAASASVATLSCPPAVRSLGMVAITTRDRLVLLDLATCRLTTLPGVGAAEPRFSPDGRWLAYAQLVHGRPSRPVVVPARGGGPTRAPLGSGIASWSWGPRGATLYGLTDHGSLLAVSPTGRRRAIATGLPSGGGFAVSPDGRGIVVNRSHCGQPAHTRGELERVDPRTGRRNVIVTQAGQPFALAGFSPDGRWLVFWQPSAMCSASINADGMPLAAVPAAGGRPVRVIGNMLQYPDFLTWCGGRLIAAGGPRATRQTNQGSRLIASSPPAWHSHTIEPANALSWVSPACAPSGRLLAAAAGPSSGPARFGLEHRSIWLLRPDGRRLRRLAPPPARGLSDEAPRFSADGRWVMFVRARVVTVGRSATSHAQIMLQRDGGGLPLPILGFTSGDFSYYDHFEWPEEIAWDQPTTGRPATAASGTVVG